MKGKETLESARIRSALRAVAIVATLALAACLCLPGQARADETVNEFWPELDLWLNLPASFRLSSFVALSRREVTDYREGSFSLLADYAWKSGTIPGLRRRLADEAEVAEMKPMMLRWGYLSGESLEDDGLEYSEHSGILEFHLRTPLKNGILFSSRIRSDLRFLGEDHDFSWRLRYRVMVEKELKPHGISVVPYASVEPYYDSRHDKVSRVRLVGGASVGFMNRFALEGNATYQRDSASSPEELAALNLILHVRFRQRQSEEPRAKSSEGTRSRPEVGLASLQGDARRRPYSKNIAPSGRRQRTVRIPGPERVAGSQPSKEEP